MWSGQDKSTGIYLVLSSSEGKDNASNKWYDFQIDLPKDLDLFSYNVALCEINFTSEGRFTFYKYVNVCTDIVQPGWVMGKWQQCLRSLSLQFNKTVSNKTFHRLQYINCVQGKFTSIHVYLTDSATGEVLKTQDEGSITQLTLHLVKQGTYIDMANLQLNSSVDRWKKHYQAMIASQGANKTGIMVAKATSVGHGVTANGSLATANWGSGLSRPASAQRKRKRSRTASRQPPAKRRKKATKAKPKKKTGGKKKKPTKAAAAKPKKKTNTKKKNQLRRKQKQ